MEGETSGTEVDASFFFSFGIFVSMLGGPWAYELGLVLPGPMEDGDRPNDGCVRKTVLPTGSTEN